MTAQIQNCYNNFITRIMKTTALPISEMQTLNEWVENRVNEFNNSCSTQKIHGFEYWLNNRYNNQ